MKNKPRAINLRIIEHQARPSSESELAEMAAGEVVRVTHQKPFRNKDVYGGNHNGEYEFLIQDAQNPSRINSFRISRENIRFDTHWGILLGKNHTNLVQYTPNDPEYDSKKQMLIKAGYWGEAA